MSTEQLISAYKSVGQGQVFAFWDSLSNSERDALASQAAEVDLGEIKHLNETLVFKKGGAGVNLDGLQPAPVDWLPENGGDPKKWAAANAAGEAALRAGRVAAFTVAGGQGTRLGYDGPKGTFAVTPIRKKSLFQVFAEKIKAAGLRYGKPLHWFIMTCHANHEQTEQFFAANKFFGLEKSRVHFFRQGRMPAVGFDGKILLETKASLAMSPDGHGGSLRALQRSGALDLMAKEGIDTISYFQVDNPIVRCIDPEFIGFHLLAKSEMSSKMVVKAYPEEKVGHFSLQDGKVVVIAWRITERRTHSSVRAICIAPWVRNIIWHRRSTGSSRNLRDSTPDFAEPHLSRPWSSGARHRSMNIAKSRGHFSLRPGGIMTTTGRFFVSLRATDAATARETNVLPMPTSSARMAPGR